MILMSHPTGNANVRQVALALHREKRLTELWTSLAWNSQSLLERILPASWTSQFRRREWPESLQSSIRTSPVKEICRLLLQSKGPQWLTRRESGVFCVDAIYRSLDRRVARRLMQSQFSGVYCYEDGALETFRTARNCGHLCVYDLPIAYWRWMHELLREETERLPAWKVTLEGLKDSPAKLRRKDDELALAHAIVTPSRFVQQSLRDQVGGTPVLVAEFGSPTTRIDTHLHAERLRALKRGEPMRVLFAGSMSQRKGLADLFSAFALLDRSDIELVVMGPPLAPMEFYRGQYRHFRYERTRSHPEVLQLMQSCHLLALPSMAEGRALVQQEAMSCGLPIVVTPNAGGDDLVIEGETGRLVPIRSPEVIAEAIAWFADRRTEWGSYSEAACRKAATYQWEGYGMKVAGFVEKLLNEHHGRV